MINMELGQRAGHQLNTLNKVKLAACYAQTQSCDISAIDISAMQIRYISDLEIFQECFLLKIRLDIDYLPFLSHQQPLRLVGSAALRFERHPS